MIVLVALVTTVLYRDYSHVRNYDPLLLLSESSCIGYLHQEYAHKEVIQTCQRAVYSCQEGLAVSCVSWLLKIAT